jgi:poly(3-hydroxybutyrate) depolymerase
MESTYQLCNSFHDHQQLIGELMRRAALIATTGILYGLTLMLLSTPFLAASESQRAAEIPVGLSDFEFVDDQGNADKPIRVWLYRPTEYSAESPILFVMHGTLRNGETYRKPWIPLADQYQCLVVVPEFLKEHYRSTRTYHFGNMRTKEGRAIKSSKWTFSAIEHLFDDIRARAGSRRKKYSIFGHSAGSQFVHRMVLFRNNLRIDRAVAANAGSYTLPSFETEFPYGLKKSPASDSQLREAFTVPLLVLLGEHDTDANDKYLPRAPEAQAQGKHRLARGQHFFSVAQESAGRLKCDLKWQVEVVPNVGHDNKKMAPAAARAMFGMPR